MYVYVYIDGPGGDVVGVVVVLCAMSRAKFSDVYILYDTQTHTQTHREKHVVSKAHKHISLLIIVRAVGKYFRQRAAAHSSLDFPSLPLLRASRCTADTAH